MTTAGINMLLAVRAALLPCGCGANNVGRRPPVVLEEVMWPCKRPCRQLATLVPEGASWTPRPAVRRYEVGHAQLGMRWRGHL
eukprot:5468914-Prorocentrum_lima.AAC.1